MNKIILIGNLTKDPELRTTSSGINVCRFSIAVNRPVAGANGERAVDFFDCTAWRKLAELVNQYCTKGKKVAVTGHVQLGSYEDNQGVKRKTFDVIAQDVEFLTSNKNSEHGANTAPYTQSAATPAEQQFAPRKKPILQEFEDDDEIPF